MITVQDRLTIAAEALKQYPTDISAIDDFSAEDLAKIASDFEIKPTDHPKLIGVMIYIRKRTTEGLGLVKSFRSAFPERCVAVNDPERPGYFAGGMVGEDISTSAIEIKAKRLENSQMYLKVYQVLQTNLYVSFAIDRFKVIQEAYDRSMDPLVADRDKAPYMKIFLEETRKPEKAAGVEFNLNLTHNELNVIGVEEKMSNMADSMKGYTASQLVELMHTPKEKDD